MKDSPPIWVYVVVIVAGIILFCGAVYCLVMTVRATEIGKQFYWAFNFVVVISATGLLLTMFAIEKK